MPSLPVKRALNLSKVAKGAGTVVLTIVALDLLATAITFAVGAAWLRR